MNDPLDHGVNDLLERVTRELPHVDLVDTALHRAARARARRRAAVAGVAAAGVAAVVGIAVALQPGASHPDQQHPVPMQKVPSPKIFDAPALPADIVAPPLDLGEALHTPAGEGLPTSLTPHDAVDTPPERALMVTKERRGDQQVFYALDTSMKWHKLHVDAPADIGNGLGPMLDADALSPDGTEVALRGAKNMYVVDLATGQTIARRSTGGSTAHWTGDHTLSIVKDFRTQQTTDGDTVITVGGRGFTETQGGSLTVRAKIAAQHSYGLANPAATNGRLAATAGPPFVGGSSREPGPGILVLDRPSYRGVAFLPTSRVHEFFRGYLTAIVPRGWLDQDTLLFSYSPPVVRAGTIQMPTEHYLLWNVPSGTVSKVASVDQYWRDSSWASQLLKR